MSHFFLLLILNSSICLITFQNSYMIKVVGNRLPFSGLPFSPIICYNQISLHFDYSTVYSISISILFVAAAVHRTVIFDWSGASLFSHLSKSLFKPSTVLASEFLSSLGILLSVWLLLLMVHFQLLFLLFHHFSLFSKYYFSFFFYLYVHS